MKLMQWAVVLAAAGGLTTSGPIEARGGETVLLDFHAPWCGPCRQMEPVVQQLIAAGYPVRKVNVDQERALAARHRVSNIPCFVLLVDGREADRVVGVADSNRLLAMFRKGAVAPSQLAATTHGPTEPAAGIEFPATGNGRSTDPFAGTLAPSSNGPIAAGGAAADQTVNMEERLRRATMRLKIDDRNGHSYGSGTIIDAREGEALILTCGHVFRDSQGKGRILVDLFGPGAPQQLAGRMIHYDLKNDLGLISVSTTYPVTVARLASPQHSLRQGDRVYNVGCNGGADATVRASHITSVNKFLGTPNVQVAGQPVQGRSGGGLFSSDGLVIGVCNAADPADNEGLYASLPAIHGKLDEINLGFVYRQPVTSPVALAAAAPPPARMPNLPTAVPASMPRVVGGSAAAEPAGTSVGPLLAVQPRSVVPTSGNAAGQGEQLTAEEEAALAEIRAKLQGAEVICIVRPLSDPRAPSEIIVIDRASPVFLQRLAAEQQSQAASHHASVDQPPVGGR